MRRKFDRAIFARLWNDHSIPTKRIAEAMGISRAGVSWHAHKMGLPSRAKLRTRKHEPDLLREMWAAGVSTADIAKHFGMAHQACAVQAARNLGLPHRERGPSGKMNGGWPKNKPLAEFLAERGQARLAARMAEAATGEQRAAVAMWRRVALL